MNNIAKIKPFFNFFLTFTAQKSRFRPVKSEPASLLKTVATLCGHLQQRILNDVQYTTHFLSSQSLNFTARSQTTAGELTGISCRWPDTGLYQ
jgi:hypothetical protein